MRVARMALLVAPLIALLAVAAPAEAQTIPATGVGSATVVPLQVTGPPANRFNLVIAGDGYTEAEQDKFMAAGRQAPEHHVEHRAVQELPELHQRLRDQDHLRRVGDRLRSEPDVAAQGHAAEHGASGAAAARRASSAWSRSTTPRSRATPRSRRACRSAWRSATATPTAAPAARTPPRPAATRCRALISPHEIGHSLGGLQDEYDYYTRGVLGGCYTGGEPTLGRITRC